MAVRIALEVDEVMEISDIDTDNIMEMPRIISFSHYPRFCPKNELIL